MTLNDVNQDFAKWACSFSGCDGVDPTETMWLCGIEWGYGKSRGETDEEYDSKVISKYYTDELKREICGAPSSLSENGKWDDCLKFPYGRTAAKLFMAMAGYEVNKYLDIDNKGIRIPFRLNLYPVGFRFASDFLWTKYGLDEITGLMSKEAYRTWCFVNRFPYMASKVKEHKPKLIIGVGVSYLIDFFVCFAGGSGCGNIHTKEIRVSENEKKYVRRLYWSRINGGQTLLAVVPFFSGQSGLNSNALIREFGLQLRELQN